MPHWHTLFTSYYPSLDVSHLGTALYTVYAELGQESSMVWNDSGAQPRMVTRQVVATSTGSSFACYVFGARVYPYHVPSFSATTASEKTLGNSPRVEEKPWITEMKTARLNLTRRLALSVRCSGPWLSNLAGTWVPVICHCLLIVIFAESKLESSSAFCVSAE